MPRGKKAKVAAQTQDNVAGNSSENVAIDTGQIVITMLPVDKLKPRRDNPNEMQDQDFAAYVSEIKKTKRPSKPIAVVKKKDMFEIVDGEQTWLASREAGLTLVPCQILNEQDEFAIMRQMIIRNKHGENHPVLLGRLFQKMLKMGSDSNRDLATELDVTEGTIRFYLKYVQAAELRNSYAKDGVERIGKLTGRQVDMYLKLPETMRDDWLKADAKLNDPAAIKAAKDNAKPKKLASVPAEPASSDDEDEQTAVSPEQAPTDDNKPLTALESILGYRLSNDEGSIGGVPEDNGGAVTEDVGNDQADNDASATAGNEASVPSSTDVPDEDVSEEEVIRALDQFWDCATPDAQRVFLTGILSDATVRNMVMDVLVHV